MPRSAMLAVYGVLSLSNRIGLSCVGNGGVLVVVVVGAMAGY